MTGTRLCLQCRPFVLEVFVYGEELKTGNVGYAKGWKGRKGKGLGRIVACSPFLNANFALIDCPLLFLHLECRYDGLPINAASTHSRP